jgi:hypothetical protein
VLTNDQQKELCSNYEFRSFIDKQINDDFCYSVDRFIKQIKAGAKADAVIKGNTTESHLESDEK